MAAEPHPKRLRVAIEPHSELPVQWVNDDSLLVYVTPKSPAVRLFHVVNRLDFDNRGEDVEKEATRLPAGKWCPVVLLLIQPLCGDRSDQSTCGDRSDLYFLNGHTVEGCAHYPSIRTCVRQRSVP